MLRNYFTTAWRSLLRNKVYSIINIFGLFIGLACAMLIMLYTKDEWSYDKFQMNGDNIFRIVNKEISPDGAPDRFNSTTSYFHGPTFASAIPEMSVVVRFQGDQRNIKKGNEVLREEAHKTDATFFTAFSFPLLYGDAKNALKEPHSVVLSEDLALKYFGTTNAVGQTLIMKEDTSFQPFTVTAVAKKCPQNSSIKFNLLTPILTSPQDLNRDNWFNFFLNTFVILPPGTDVKKVNEKMQRFYEADAKNTIEEMKEQFGVKTKTVYFLQPFADMHLNKDLSANNGLSDGSNPIYALILSGIALFILLIACINFVNLTVARSLKRAKEIGIRKVIGSNRKQLILQFLGESFILCLIAFLIAILLVQILLPTFNHLANKSLSLSYLVDLKLVAGYLTLLMITAILAGFYPALVLSSFNPVKTLYSRFAYRGKNYLQRSLVVLQFVLATILIIATITIYRQFNYLTTKPLGYDDSNLVSVEKWGISRKEAALFQTMLKTNPNIVNTAPKNGGYWSTMAKINGETQIMFSYETVDESYLPLMKIPLVQGRNFSKEFVSDSSQSVIVNEAFVKKAGWKKPIGEMVNFWYNKKLFSVIGVVKDHHFEGVSRTIEPQLLTMNPENEFGKVFIKIKPGSDVAILPIIESTFKKNFPLFPYSYNFKHDENQKQYEAEAKWRQMMLFGAIITIFISCIGLFGLSVLNAERRVKEIGIRKVLGASVSSVASALSKDFLLLVSLALVIGIPVAWLLTKQWLQNYPYRVAVGWTLFVPAAVLILLVALATVSVQAIKAAMANPTKNLRSE